MRDFILLIADNISWSDLGCYGDRVVKTPHIDQLATDGVLFHNAYLTISSCSPSRCSIITGRYPHNTGACELHTALPDGQFMFPQHLKEAGYYTVLSGKNHMGEAVSTAFTRILRGTGPGGEADWVDLLRSRPKGQPFFNCAVRVTFGFQHFDSVLPQLWCCARLDLVGAADFEGAVYGAHLAEFGMLKGYHNAVSFFLLVVGSFFVGGYSSMWDIRFLQFPMPVSNIFGLENVRNQLNQLRHVGSSCFCTGETGIVGDIRTGQRIAKWLPVFIEIDDAQLHQTFYYPPGILDEKTPASRQIQPINYGDHKAGVSPHE